MDKMLRVDMTTREVKTEAVPEKYAVLGGRALTSQFVLDEVPPTCEPLGPFNKLIFAPGLLTGTGAPSSGRISVGGKSPLTGTIKEANAGGISPQMIASLGYKAIVIEGKPPAGEFYLLRITADGAELLPAGDLAGKGGYQTVAMLKERYGEKVGVLFIGPAGEMLMAGAGVGGNDPEGNAGRYAGRGGLGAVMGSKGLKAIVVDALKSCDVPVKDKERFRAAAKQFAEILHAHPVTGQGLPAYGTNVLMNIINEAGTLPTRNFSRGRFDQASGRSSGSTTSLSTLRITFRPSS